VFCGEWNIGRIYEVRGGPEHLRWFWALHFPSKPENLRTDNRVATAGDGKGGVRGELAAMAGVGKIRREIELVPAVHQGRRDPLLPCCSARSNRSNQSLAISQ
jgi:hypothetical protein